MFAYFISQNGKNYKDDFSMNSKIALDTDEEKENTPKINSSFGIMVKVELNIFALLDQQSLNSRF